MKHSCGAMVPILPGIIEAGFDIINPVQINAKDMDSQRLKDEFGQQLTFWGGGIDTQQVLPYGTPDEVRRHVIRQCEIFGKMVVSCSTRFIMYRPMCQLKISLLFLMH